MQTDTMREPPTRSDVANFEKQARRVLTKSRDRDVRQLAKDFIDWSMQIDRYVESMYPCFSIMEEKVRVQGMSFSLENDGVWRLRDVEKAIVMTGSSLKDLFVNVLLWDDSEQDEEFFEECSTEEDAIFEPNKRKPRLLE
jgi:hypothetical protein